MTSETISGKIAVLKSSIEETARSAGRSSKDIQLLLVTKTVSPERILEAVNEGFFDFGENRVQEMLEKKKELLKVPSSDEIRWHLIGHLQTNKVKQVLGEAVSIHSQDSPELARDINRQADLKKMAAVDCLVQVNSSGEKTKYGLPPEAVSDFVASLKGSKIRVRGLMTIAPLTENETWIRECFKKVRNLQDSLKKTFSFFSGDILSMGMSSDYKIAIEEGSTLIRIGSAVFGARQ